MRDGSNFHSLIERIRTSLCRSKLFEDGVDRSTRRLKMPFACELEICLAILARVPKKKGRDRRPLDSRKRMKSGLGATAHDTEAKKRQH
jgi:hypothetical protein